MENPFKTIEEQLQRIEEVLTTIKDGPVRKDPPAEPKIIYSLAELAQFLNCSITTAQKLKNSRRIRFKQYGRKVLFNASEVLEDLSKERRGK